MCTAIAYKTDDFYFGRNLDLWRGYDECVTVAPRSYPFKFKNGLLIDSHPAIIGMACQRDGYPLFFDAVSEVGLCIAGLNFPQSAVYHHGSFTKINITPFELIPYILCSFTNAGEAAEALCRVNLWNVPFSKDLPLSPLHWLIADKVSSYTVEPMESGLSVLENPVGVLTNEPPFDFHMHNLANYMNLTPEQPTMRFAEELHLQPYSLGLGSFGLPGDLSSSSRFIRATFTKLNSPPQKNETESVSQFFHILSNVSQLKGQNMLLDGSFEYTRYSSCCNADKGIYYYTTYDNSAITAVDLQKVCISGDSLLSFALLTGERILWQN